MFNQPHIVTSDTDKIVTFDANMRGKIKSFKAIIQFEQTGSGDPSPTNIRPITYFTGADMGFTGRNIFDADRASFVVGKYISNTGAITSQSGYKYTDHRIPVKPSTTYTVQFDKTTQSRGFTVPFYDESDTFISRATAFSSSSSSGHKTGTFTTPSNCAYIRFSCGTAFTNIMIEEGSTEHTYDAFCNTYGIDWSGNAGNVAIGTFDLISGKLTVEAAAVVVREINAVSSTGKYAIQRLGDYNTIRMQEGTCNCLKKCEQTIGYLEGGSQWRMSYSSTIGDYLGFTINGKPSEEEETDEDKIAAVNTELATLNHNGTPMVFVYYPKDPVVFQFTPEQIKTIVGTNNSWADPFDVKVEYWEY